VAREDAQFAVQNLRCQGLRAGLYTGPGPEAGEHWWPVEVLAFDTAPLQGLYKVLG
jgi:hypothetical protein